jgi:DNA-binding transcriptional LysR family regulator
MLECRALRRKRRTCTTEYGMHLRQLEYLAALERERHFGRAAEACNISQPALSQALRSIEAAFGVPIVDRRHQGFHGFTPEGELVLDWVRRVLAGHDTLTQQIGSVNAGDLGGHVRLGVIPVATPMVSMLTTAFHRRHPRVTIAIRSMNFMEIERSLEKFEIEVGVNYVDAGPATGLRTYMLYDESYYLLAPKNHPVGERSAISWSEAGALPLCLLTPDMQNRRIINQIFDDVGVSPRTVIETNCAVTLCSHVRSGQWFTIVPQTFFYLLGGWAEPRAIPLVAPVVTNPIGLFISERHPLPPVINAFVEVVQSLVIDSELRKHVPEPALAGSAA